MNISKKSDLNRNELTNNLINLYQKWSLTVI